MCHGTWSWISMKCFMSARGIPLKHSMAFHGNTWKSMERHGIPWNSYNCFMNIDEHSRMPTKSPKKKFYRRCAGRRTVVRRTHPRLIGPAIWLHWNIDRTPFNFFIDFRHEMFHGLPWTPTAFFILSTDFHRLPRNVSSSSMDFHDTLHQKHYNVDD